MATIKSIEEKAKAYDIALDKIKRLLGTGSSCSREELEYVFSELKESKESEDEKIRKEIIDIIDSYDVAHLKAAGLPSRIPKYIAWLEKQGEQKHTAEEVLIKAGLKPYKDGDQWCVLLGDNIQKGICGFGNTIEDALYAFLKDLIASQGDQNPAWSEEDERMFAAVIADIQFTQKAHNHEVNQIVYEREIDWLKSLRLQSHWKPSDEQMEALRKVEATIGVNHVVLAGLISDLEKLTE